MKQTLKKDLTLYGLTMIAVGSCIGSGIFITPAEIAQVLPDHYLILLVWTIGGVIGMTGALTFAELGGLFPKAGGVYVFLKEAYGELAGFLYGWVILLVATTGALAALAMAFAEYLTFFFPDLSQVQKTGIAAITITFLTAINVTGVNISQWFANVFSGLKLAAIFGIVAIGVFFADPEVTITWTTNEAKPDNLVSALLIALIGVLWSGGGWHHASYLAGEAKNASRTVPRAMILGVLIVTITYLLVNIAYMRLLSLETIAGTERVAGDAVATIIPFGGKLVAVAIAISIFGTIGIYTMSAPRIYFAMAKDGLFFNALAQIHPKFQTPANAMIVQAAWSIVLLLAWGSFSKLITYVTFMDIVFMALAAFSIYLYRRRLPDAPRPVKAWGYPIVPMIYIFICSAFVVSTLHERPEQAGAGLVLLGLGVPVFQYFKRNRKGQTIE